MTFSTLEQTYSQRDSFSGDHECLYKMTTHPFSLPTWLKRTPKTGKQIYFTGPFTILHCSPRFTPQKETHLLSLKHGNMSPPLLLTSIDLMTFWLYKERICQHLVLVFNSFSTGFQQAH